MHPPDPTNERAPQARGDEFSNQQRALGEMPRHFMSDGQHPSTPPKPELFLSRLERVRKAGDGWSARCPAHEDRTASLSIAVGHDDRILAHCFAGCAIADVLGAIGLTVNDLFAKRTKDASPEARRELQGLSLKSRLQACANVLDHESGVVLIAAGDLHQGRMLTDADHARLATAVERIRAARVAIGGRQ